MQVRSVGTGTVVEKTRVLFCPPRSAYTSQVPHMFSDSLRENILLGVPESDEILGSALIWRAGARYREMLRVWIRFEGVGPAPACGLSAPPWTDPAAAAARMFVRRAELLVVDDLSSALTWKQNLCCGRDLCAQERRCWPFASPRSIATARPY